MFSMTGYGRKQASSDGREMTLEIKTVNHRFLDLSFKMPRSFSCFEDVMRKEISHTLKRGHVDVFLTYSNTRQDAKEVCVDTALLKQYKHAFDQIKDTLGVEDDVKTSFYASLQDVLTIKEKEDDNEALKHMLLSLLKEVLKDVLLMREKEGKALKEDLMFHLQNASDIQNQLLALAPFTAINAREKLEERLQNACTTQIDPQRLAQEVVILSDKCAIDEELTRLESHIEQMQDAIKSNKEVGRRLDFITQELNRETNTIGSKSSDVKITNLVVDLKSEIEKMREQVQNVE